MFFINFLYQLTTLLLQGLNERLKIVLFRGVLMLMMPMWMLRVVMRGL